MNEITTNSRYMKVFNRLRIVNLVRNHQSISRKDLAKISGLTPAAITGIIKELISDNLIIETGQGSSGGGRKPVFLAFNHEIGYVIGVEIRRLILTMGYTDMKNLPTDIESLPIEFSKPEELLDFLAEHIQKLVAKNEDKRFLGIGLAIPGLVNTDTGKIIRSVNLGTAWTDFPVVDYLGSKIDLPIFIDNNSNAAVFAEHIFDTTENSIRSLAFINFGDGISAGIINEDALTDNRRGFSCELGHISIGFDGPKCNCGNNGCLEATYGIRALLNKINNEIVTISDEDYAKKLWREKGRLVEDDFIYLIDNDSRYIKEIVTNYLKYMGFAIASVINMYNPEVIFIGGKMSIVAERFFPKLLVNTSKCSFPELFNQTIIRISSMADRASVSGACALVLRGMLGSTKNGLFN